jgi:uroporphyrinogen-III synthase
MTPPHKPSKNHNLPLKDQRILIGRAKHQASALSEQVKALGAQVLEIPFIEIRKPRSYRPLDEALVNIQNYDWLILTSVNGVEAVWERIKKLRLSASRLKHLKIAAIGPATKKAIEAHGLRVHVVPKQYVAESVVKSLRKHVAGKRILLARARVARDVIPRELRKAGAIVDVLEAYQTVLPKSSRDRLRKALRNPKLRPTIATFTSSSMARNFVALVGARSTRSAVRNGLRLASIGSITSATLRDFNLPVHVEAKQFTIPGLVQAVQRLKF